MNIKAKLQETEQEFEQLKQKRQELMQEIQNVDTQMLITSGKYAAFQELDNEQEQEQ